MKHLISLFLLATPLLAQAAPTKLLDCNLSDGDTQQVTVIREEGRLKLVELTTSGGFKERELSSAEWNSRSLKLWTRYEGIKATVTREANGSWYFLYDGAGYRAQGYADCWIKP